MKCVRGRWSDEKVENGVGKPGGKWLWQAQKKGIGWHLSSEKRDRASPVKKVTKLVPPYTVFPGPFVKNMKESPQKPQLHVQIQTPAP